MNKDKFGDILCLFLSTNVMSRASSTMNVNYLQLSIQSPKYLRLIASSQTHIINPMISVSLLDLLTKKQTNN